MITLTSSADGFSLLLGMLDYRYSSKGYGISHSHGQRSSRRQYLRSESPRQEYDLTLDIHRTR
jgi:hypothetical protein